MTFKQHKNGMYEVWFYAKDLRKVVEMVKTMEAHKAEVAVQSSAEVNTVSLVSSDDL